MNIDKALNHFDFKIVERDPYGKPLSLKNNFKPTKNDIKAINAIIEYKENNEINVVMRNEGYAKLYIHLITKLCSNDLHTLERSIQIIDEILDNSTYGLCLVLKTKIEASKYERFAQSKYPIVDYTNITKLRERNDKISKEFEPDILKALEHKISEENIIKFIESQVVRTINKYEKTI